jgi:hypothetical protein
LVTLKSDIIGTELLSSLQKDSSSSIGMKL